MPFKFNHLCHNKLDNQRDLIEYILRTIFFMMLFIQV